jgi:Ca2+-binding EF-hand superfamily protein
VIANANRDDNGFIYYDEFLKIMIPRLAFHDSKEEMLKALKMIDSNDFGIIIYAERKKLCKELVQNQRKKI